MSKTQSAPLVCLLLVSLWCTSLSAQADPRQQRRQFVEGLLKTLIQSQLDPQRRPPPRPNQPPVSPELAQARQHFKQFSTHSTQLVHHLNTQAGSVPAAKQWLGDTIKLNASVSHINTRAATAGSIADLQPDFRELDRQWRVLSHRLRRAEGLDDACLQCVNRLSELDTTLCGVLGVPPQVDYRELLSASIALDTSLTHLIEDIELELPRNRHGRAIEAEVGQVEQRARWFVAAVTDQLGHDQLVDRFTTFYASWRKVASKIQGLGSRHLDRTLRRVDESGLLLHELLWIQQPLDYGQLVHLTKRLSADVDGLFEQVSLNVLLDLPRAERVLPIASEFYGLCENFLDSVATQASLEQLRRDYRFLVDAWPELAGCFQAANDPDVAHSLRAVEGSFVALRETIGLRASIDWRRAAELGASLTVLSDRLITDVQRYVFTNRAYQHNFRVQSARHAANVRGASRRLHECLVSRDEATVQARTQELAEAWGTITDACFGHLNAADQHRFANTRSQMTQQVVQLQAMLRF